ncbi:MAG: YfhO family protein [Acidobacteria bacterium]|nr:YfhO family protein [Acidobacteriota bacterium]
MKRPIGPLAIAVFSLVFTGLFFFEYLPPLKWVHIPYDLEGFHYPLLDYALQSLRQGRFPEWDPSTYCGLSFVGNVQAGLFYPPNWLLFPANRGHSHLVYKRLEILVLAHVWLAFFLCYLWLRHKRLAMLPAVLGAGVFAYSGYLLLQLQHLGLVAGYAWMPLGLLGIDEANEAGHWRPLWKLVAASALCFLAGYPPTWFVFCVCAMVYALAGPGRWRAGLWSGLALAASLLVAAVQWMPAAEAASMKTPQPKYGQGIRMPEYFLSYLLPNYFDFGLHGSPAARFDANYLYLGAPALFGLAWLAGRRLLRGWGPLLAVAGVSFIVLTNAFGLVWEFVRHFPLLAEICRDWYFLAGLTLAAAPLAAAGLDDFLKGRPQRPAPPWLMPVTIGILVAWSLRQLFIWLPGGPEFASGWRDAVEPAVMLAVFSLGLFVLRGEQGGRRAVLTAALLLAVAVDYKVFGTSKRFNAAEGDLDKIYSDAPFRGVPDPVYEQLRSHPEYRVALDLTGPFTASMHSYGLSTPQGFDPLLPARYKEKIEAQTKFRGDREFDIDPANEDLLRSLGVRYFITTEDGPAYPSLSSNPSFRRMEPSSSYFKVFEFRKAQPAYRWDIEDPAGPRSAERAFWSPERREFLVRSAAPGRFVLVEQFYPGWRATLDGKPAPIERWEQAFQSVQVPAGEHRIRFEFRSSGLRAGVVISMISLVALVILTRRKTR